MKGGEYKIEKIVEEEEGEESDGGKNAKDASSSKRSSKSSSSSSSSRSQASGVRDLLSSVKSGSKVDKGKINKNLLNLLKNQVKVTEDFSAAMKEKLGKKDGRIGELEVEINQLKAQMSNFEPERQQQRVRKRRLSELESELTHVRQRLQLEKTPKSGDSSSSGRVTLLFFLFMIVANVCSFAVFNPSFSRALGIDGNSLLDSVRIGVGIQSSSSLIAKMSRHETSLARNLSLAQSENARLLDELSLKESCERDLKSCDAERDRLSDELFKAGRECSQKNAAALADCKLEAERAQGGKREQGWEQSYELQNAMMEVERLKILLKEEKIRARILKDEFQPSRGRKDEYSSRSEWGDEWGRNSRNDNSPSRPEWGDDWGRRPGDPDAHYDSLHCQRNIEAAKREAETLSVRLELLNRTAEDAQRHNAELTETCGQAELRVAALEKDAEECGKMRSDLSLCLNTTKSLEGQVSSLEGQITQTKSDDAARQQYASDLDAFGNNIQDLISFDSGMINNLVNRVKLCSNQVEILQLSANLNNTNLENCMSKSLLCDSNLRTASDLIKTQEGDIQAVENELLAAKKTANACAAESAELSSQLERLDAESAELVAESAELSSQLEDLQSAFKSAGKTFKEETLKFQDQVVKAGKAQLLLEVAFNDCEKELAHTASSKEVVQQQVATLETTLDGCQSKSTHSQGELAECVIRLDSFRSSVEKLVILEAGTRKAYYDRLENKSLENMHCVDQLAAVHESVREQQLNNTALSATVSSCYDELELHKARPDPSLVGELEARLNEAEQNLARQSLAAEESLSRHALAKARMESDNLRLQAELQNALQQGDAFAEPVVVPEPDTSAMEEELALADRENELLREKMTETEELLTQKNALLSETQDQLSQKFEQLIESEAFVVQLEDEQKLLEEKLEDSQRLCEAGCPEGTAGIEAVREELTAEYGAVMSGLEQQVAQMSAELEQERAKSSEEQGDAPLREPTECEPAEPSECPACELAECDAAQLAQLSQMAQVAQYGVPFSAAMADFKTDLVQNMSLLWLDVPVPIPGVNVSLSLPTLKPLNRSARAFSSFRTWSMPRKAVLLALVAALDVVLVQMLFPESRLCMVLVVLMWAFLSWQCFFLESFVLASLFGANALLGVLYFCFPGRALKISFSGGFLAFTS